MTEESRAAQYRAGQQAGERAALARWKALAGSKVSYNTLYANTSPLMRDEGWDPVEYVTEAEMVANDGCHSC